MESQQAKLPQLKMRCNRLDALPPVKLPPGYSLCTLLGRDEADWIDALNATGQLGEWDRHKARKWLEGERHVIKEGAFLITFADRPVATASTLDPAQGAEKLELGWVSASPDHQAKGLGYQVCLAVMHYTHNLGYPETYLSTDDWRLPAIKTYLNLGFEPAIIHESHPARWKVVYETLGVARDSDS